MDFMYIIIIACVAYVSIRPYTENLSGYDRNIFYYSNDAMFIMKMKLVV